MLKYYDHCFWLLVDEEVIKKFDDIEQAESEAMRLAAIAAHLDRISKILDQALGSLQLKFPLDAPLADPTIQKVKGILDDVLDEMWHFNLRIEDNCPHLKVENCTDE
jgi:hypothetical protein